ncbi:hypothetical protein RchiOBHm_Chr1g0358381 [Rosa chinensis]|uniref:Uncharacterized protein n=1 Tax=Rosa chinensis TaxID=74649 RepID=A0A2P6SI38_ROSCH|nr:hypothetical protein RchiOBHm_Chr1g0358381 [Rosa chinensis]
MDFDCRPLVGKGKRRDRRFWSILIDFWSKIWVCFGRGCLVFFFIRGTGASLCEYTMQRCDK